MKQHITSEQWRELNNDQQLILARKFDDAPEPPEFYVDNSSLYIPISIGQMIEFLVENDVDWINELYWISKDDTMAPELISSFGNKELCDALWDAVKEELNET